MFYVYIYISSSFKWNSSHSCAFLAMYLLKQLKLIACSFFLRIQEESKRLKHVKINIVIHTHTSGVKTFMQHRREGTCIEGTSCSKR